MTQILITLLLPILIVIQAGGGGNFGSGGGGVGGGFGGGGFGDSSGGIDVFRDHSGSGSDRAMGRLEIVLLACVVIAILGFKFFEAWQSGQAPAVTREVRAGLKRQNRKRQESLLQEVQQADPLFFEQQFLDRCSQGFALIQKCWAQHNLADCRAMLSDAVHARFQVYLKMQQAEQVHHRIDQLDVTEARVVAISTDPPFDTIHVQFTASALIREEPLEQMHKSAWNVPRKSFSEVWTFVRRRGALTSRQRSLLTGQCPHCGAQLVITDSNQCPHCQSFVHAGYDDWVLCEITQDCEWIVTESAAQIPGWDQLQQHDPALSLAQIEDRASVVFWRCMLSLYFQDSQMSLPVLWSESAGFPECWRVTNGGFWKLPAVGSVQLLRCLPAVQEADQDRVVVLLRWSGTRACGDRSRPHLLGRQMMFPHELTLVRRRGALSKPEDTFHTCSCRACAAPIDVTSTASCRWCGKSLNDGSYDWVLESVAPQGLWQAPSHSGRIVTKPLTLAAPDVDPDHQSAALSAWQHNFAWQSTSMPPEQIIACTAAMLKADGKLVEAEQQFLRELARQLGLTDSRLDQALTLSETALQQPPSTDQLELFLQDLIRVAFVDGRLTSEERAILKRVSAPLKWSTTTLNQQIQAVRNSIVRRSKT